MINLIFHGIIVYESEPINCVMDEHAQWPWEKVQSMSHQKDSRHQCAVSSLTTSRPNANSKPYIIGVCNVHCDQTSSAS